MSKFISLRKMYEGIKMSEATDIPEPSGPTIYVTDIDLPLTEADLDKDIEATVKLKLKRVTQTRTNGKDSNSFDLEVSAIKF